MAEGMIIYESPETIPLEFSSGRDEGLKAIVTSCIERGAPMDNDCVADFRCLKRDLVLASSSKNLTYLYSKPSTLKTVGDEHFSAPVVIRCQQQGKNLHRPLPRSALCDIIAKLHN